MAHRCHHNQKTVDVVALVPERCTRITFTESEIKDAIEGLENRYKKRDAVLNKFRDALRLLQLEAISRRL